MNHFGITNVSTLSVGNLVQGDGWTQNGANHYVFDHLYGDGGVAACTASKMTFDIKVPFATSKDHLWTGTYTVITRNPGQNPWDIAFLESGTLMGHTVYGNGIGLHPSTDGNSGTTITRGDNFSDSLFVNVPCGPTSDRVFIHLEVMARAILQ